jgi:hypothetical protein
MISAVSETSIKVERAAGVMWKREQPKPHRIPRYAELNVVKKCSPEVEPFDIYQRDV